MQSGGNNRLIGWFELGRTRTCGNNRRRAGKLKIGSCSAHDGLSAERAKE
jgi:hypothetical protein